MTTETMDLTDRKLLNIVQSKFPVVAQPYAAIAAEIGIDEGEVLARLAELKRQNVVRQISAIFDTRRLGYQTTLVAFAYADHDLHPGAIFINRHPGVSHNYAREGSYYNLWFTLAVPPDGDLETTVRWMAAANRRHRVPHYAHHPLFQNRRQLRYGQTPQRRLQLQPGRHRRQPIIRRPRPRLEPGAGNHRMGPAGHPRRPGGLAPDLPSL